MLLVQRCSTVAFLLTVVAATRSAQAGPIDPYFPQTLSEQVARSDVVLLTEWIGATKTGENAAGRTVFEVSQIPKSPDGLFERGERVILSRFRAGMRGDLFLLMGRGTKEIKWYVPFEVTEIAIQYIVQSPPRDVPQVIRLEYFLNFLEHPDELIAEDAYSEFAAARYEDIAPLAEKFPKEKLREWLFDDETRPSRVGLYGTMLGLCGDASDAERMWAIIVAETDEYRLGIDGVMGGYLLLAGEEGLEVIERTKLKNKDAPFTETYAAMQALRFVWTHGEERINPERLRQSMRLLLDRPELTEPVVLNLAKLEDWSVQDWLMEMYDVEHDNPLDTKAIRRAIVRYMLASTNDELKNGETAPSHIARGKAHLETLRKKDPQIVRQAERLYVRDHPNAQDP